VGGNKMSVKVKVGSIWRDKSRDRLIEVTNVKIDNHFKNMVVCYRYEYEGCDDEYQQYIDCFFDRFSKVELEDLKSGEYVECVKNYENIKIGKKTKIQSMGHLAILRIIYEDNWLCDVDSKDAREYFKPCLPPVIRGQRAKLNLNARDCLELTKELNIKVNSGIKNITFQDVNDNEVVIDVYEDCIDLGGWEIAYDDIDKYIESLMIIKSEWENSNN
jgi:hypothetical protein